jgi:N-acetylglucosamine kinase-like BadF-type ATPase
MVTTPHVEERHLMPVGVAIEEAARQAGVDAHRLPVADLGIFCLAGADLPADDRRLLRWTRANGWAGTDVVRNDTFAVLRAGTDRSWGVGVVCGYGTTARRWLPRSHHPFPRWDRSPAGEVLVTGGWRLAGS